MSISTSPVISVLDVSGFCSTDPLQHGTFAENPQIVKLIGRSLNSGQVLTDSRVGVGERVMELTASAAEGLAATAPIAVIDPTTREYHGERIESLTDTLPATMEAQ